LRIPFTAPSVLADTDREIYIAQAPSGARCPIEQRKPGNRRATAARVADYASSFFDPDFGLCRFDKRLQFSGRFVAYWKANDFCNSTLGNTGRVVQAA